MVEARVEAENNGTRRITAYSTIMSWVKTKTISVSQSVFRDTMNWHIFSVRVRDINFPPCAYHTHHIDTSTMHRIVGTTFVQQLPLSQLPTVPIS